MTTIHQPPALDHDAMMLRRFNSKVTPNGKLERRIVWNLFEHLKARGFRPVHVFDGEECTPVADAKAAMELIFNLDEAYVRVKRGPHERSWFTLVLGNGIDVVSDWGIPAADTGGFESAMDTFNAEDYV